MLKQPTIKTVLYSAGILFSAITFAAAEPSTSTTTNTSTTSPSSTSTTPSSGSTTSTTTSTTTQSKDEWLTKLREVVPAMICKNFTENETVNKQLKDANIDYDKCVTLIPASFDKCKDKYHTEIPATINQESASKWGRTIGECIGTDFATTHFVGSRSASTQELTKDEWLGKLKAAVPDLICKGFLQDETLSKRLTEVNINYDKCVTLIPASVDKCQNELYAQIPAKITQENAGKWGHSIGECIGKDFALKYLFNSKKQ